MRASPNITPNPKVDKRTTLYNVPQWPPVGGGGQAIAGRCQVYFLLLHGMARADLNVRKQQKSAFCFPFVLFLPPAFPVVGIRLFIISKVNNSVPQNQTMDDVQILVPKLLTDLTFASQ